MKIFIDTNVLLDIALNRQPFSENAIIIWKIIEQKLLRGYISATTITDIHFISKKYIGTEKARSFIKDILDVFEIIDADKNCFNNALNSEIIDFEDAVQYEISYKINCDYIITRNKDDFKNKTNVISPNEFILLLKKS